MQDVNTLTLAHGGMCEGPPRLRPECHANDYGAYFRDPDGNKPCLACHGAGSMTVLGWVYAMLAKQRLLALKDVT